LRILLTNVWLNQFSGSELVTLELYEFFVSNGHDVEIFTNVISPEMQEYLQKEKIFVSTPSTFAICDEYDLVWVHHQNIPSGFFDKNPLVGNWIFHHMSPFEPLEFTLNANFENSLSKVVLANSLETLEKLGSLGINLSKVEVFNNPAPASFSEYPDAKKSDSYFLFISNHPPLEILQAMDILEEMGQPFIHIGSGSRWAVSRRVMADDLAGATVVVSIGKTIQYSITMQKCFFVYDHFGGDGFVSSKSNFSENSKFNFSGRNSRSNKSAQQIVSELLQFESQNPYILGYVTDEDRVNFNLQTKIEGLFSRLDFSMKLPFLAHVEPKSLEVFRGSLDSIRRSIVNEFNMSVNYSIALAERDSAVAQRDSAVAQRDSVLNSTIWKLFKPYRKLRNIFLR
jgi:hypothetical protein